MSDFRIYAKKGCPFCDGIKGFLFGNGMKFDVVEIENDPIAYNGIKAMFGKVELPVVLSFWTEQAICGYKPEAYEKLVSDVVARRDASLRDGHNRERVGIQAPADDPLAQSAT